MSKRSSDDLDGGQTDELPVLLETVAFGAAVEPLFAASRTEDTSEHTVLYHPAAEDGALADLREEMDGHLAKIANLEAQLAAQTYRGRDLEQRLTEQEQLRAERERSLATLRQSAQDANSAEQRLTAQLAARDARLTELSTTIEVLQRDAGARSAEIERLRAAAETARREADAANSELTARPAAPAPLADAELLEDNAALTTYIAGRRAWWDEAQAKQANLAARVAALEHELAGRAKQLSTAEALAARESSRATGLRAELVDYARRATALERELRELRTATEPPALAAARPVAIPPAEPVARVPSARATAPAPPESPLPAETAAAPAFEAIAQLEAEVEYKRQQVAAQLVELRDRDQRLRTATSELERLGRDLATLRTELDESRSNGARLERAVIDKDRALDARDARIATLHEELKQRLGAIEKLNAMEFALPKRDPGLTTRTGAVDAGIDASAPALLCLTGEAPKRFALTKKTVTVGRGPQCDLQILTHFVSREHARITLSGGNAFIEDLGSRNGVFVNSVRVDRRALAQGDLVMIGETQFRFVESMAH